MTEFLIPTVAGPRLRLRSLELSDCDAFLAGVISSTALHSPWVNPPRTVEEFEAYVRRRSASFIPLGVFHKELGAPFGIFNLNQIFRGDFCSAYLGYYAFVEHAGKGNMREGLDLLLHLAFKPLGLHRLEANIQPSNVSSIALVKRCGFQLEGYSPGYLRVAGAWRDHERWAIRHEIWTQRDDITME